MLLCFHILKCFSDHGGDDHDDHDDRDDDKKKILIKVVIIQFFLYLKHKMTFTI